MTVWFSTAFSEDGTANSFDPADPVSRGALDGGRVAYKRAFIDLLGVPQSIGTQLRMFSVKSGDRPIAIFQSAVATGDTVPNPQSLRVDLREQGDAHDGDVVGSASMFGGENVSVEVDRVDILGSVFDDEDRGRAFWEYVNLNDPGTFASNPKQDWDVNLRQSGSQAEVGEVVLELYYLPESG